MQFWRPKRLAPLPNTNLQHPHELVGAAKLNSLENFDMNQTSTIRRHSIIATGIYLAASLRVSAQKQEILRLEGFLIGFIAGAEMIVRTFEDLRNSTDSFLCEQANLQGILSSCTFHKVRSQIGEHQIAEKIRGIETQRNESAASASLLVPKIAKNIGAATGVNLQILVIAIMATATTHFANFGVDMAQEVILNWIHEL